MVWRVRDRQRQGGDRGGLLLLFLLLLLLLLSSAPPSHFSLPPFVLPPSLPFFLSPSLASSPLYPSFLPPALFRTSPPLLNQFLQVSMFFTLVCLKSRRPPGGPGGPREGPRRALGGLPGARGTRGAQVNKNPSPYFLQGPFKRPSLLLVVSDIPAVVAASASSVGSLRPLFSSSASQNAFKMLTGA